VDQLVNKNLMYTIISIVNGKFQITYMPECRQGFMPICRVTISSMTNEGQDNNIGFI